MDSHILFKAMYLCFNLKILISSGGSVLEVLCTWKLLMGWILRLQNFPDMLYILLHYAMISPGLPAEGI